MSAPGDGVKTPPPRSWLRSAGARHGIVLGGGMLVAGTLDYGVNVVAGRRLEPTEFGVFVSVTALLQVLLSVATAIRMVVAFYTAELSAAREHRDAIGAFLRRAARWCSLRSGVAMAMMAVATPALGRAFRLPTPWPLRAAGLMVMMLFMREAALGALQGVQAFTGLAVVQVSQAVLRFALAAALIAVGAGAAGAIVAQPIAAVGAVAVAAWWLRPYLAAGAHAPRRPVSWSYSVATVIGLALFGVLTNLDALFVKLVFTPRVAGDYGTVVTFEKINLFLPWAVSFVLFPKAVRRHAAGQDARPILLLALVAAMAPGLGLTALYAAAPGLVVRTVFTDAYADPGVVLALATLAATLHAGVNIWLNYGLSTARSGFLYVLAAAVLWQGGAMVLFARESLTRMALVMAAAALAANLGGYLTTWAPARGRGALRARRDTALADGRVTG
jgi:O-antigen/teichoic acid export membrane protein